jgi:hypothetical protein
VKLRTATRALIIGITLVVITIAIIAQLVRHPAVGPACTGPTAACVRPTPTR